MTKFLGLLLLSMFFVSPQAPSSWKESTLTLDEEFWYSGTAPGDTQRATYSRDIATADAQSLLLRSQILKFAMSSNAVCSGIASSMLQYASDTERVLLAANDDLPIVLSSILARSGMHLRWMEKIHFPDNQEPNQQVLNKYVTAITLLVMVKEAIQLDDWLDIGSDPFNPRDPALLASRPPMIGYRLDQIHSKIVDDLQFLATSSRIEKDFIESLRNEMMEMMPAEHRHIDRIFSQFGY